jgi:hypothetical protein
MTTPMPDNVSSKSTAKPNSLETDVEDAVSWSKAHAFWAGFAAGALVVFVIACFV